MEMELKNIIDKIKTEGVSEAEKEAAAIRKKAEDEATALRETAKKEKEDILKGAEAEAARIKANGEAAIKQASRDVLLGLRGSILELFDKAVKAEVSEQLTQDTVKEMILKMTEALAKENTFDIEVLLSAGDKKNLETALAGALAKEAKKGVELKASPHLERGFRIGEKDGNSYYDFSDEAITEAFSAYLNPKMAELLTPKETD